MAVSVRYIQLQNVKVTGDPLPSTQRKKRLRSTTKGNGDGLENRTTLCYLLTLVITGPTLKSSKKGLIQFKLLLNLHNSFLNIPIH